MNDAIQALLIHLQSLPAQQAEERNVIREQLRQEVVTTVRTMVEANNGRVSKDLLTFMDGLYDTAGMPTLFATALVVDLHDVRQMLGRNREVVCKKCQNTFMVFELRNKGGYQNVHAEYCPDCLELKREEWAVQSVEQSTKEQKRHLLYARILSRTPYEVVSLPEFKEAVLNYANYWVSGQSTPWFGSRVGHGCMLCDAVPVGIFLTREERLSNNHNRLLASIEHEERNERDMSSRDYEPSWTLLERPFQFFIRMTPYWYFEASESTTLLHQVLLLLCEKHSDIADETHFQPYPELIYRKSATK